MGPSAHAQFSMTDDFGAEINPQPPGHRYHTDRYFTAQLTFGPFRPDIDSEFSGVAVARTPYADYFGNGRHLLIQAEAAYEIWQKVGTISLGLGAGYFSVSGSAPNADHSGTFSADKSTLTVTAGGRTFTSVWRATQARDAVTSARTESLHVVELVELPA